MDMICHFGLHWWIRAVAASFIETTNLINRNSNTPQSSNDHADFFTIRISRIRMLHSQ